MDRQVLLARLDAIGRSLEASGRALALFGLGSVGQERERIDEFSDLDFFAIVEDGMKPAYLADLSWLTALAPVAYYFRNTVDGYKLLYEDGIFCEFAVFERDELARIPFAPGQVVWKAPGISDSIALPEWQAPFKRSHATEWLLGEALTNLYIGLGRFHRGELLSAARFVQQYAVDSALELASRLEAPETGAPDQFGLERRFERRFPQVSALLPSFVQGYDRSPESALALLAWLEAHFAVAPGMAAAIRERAALP